MKHRGALSALIAPSALLYAVCFVVPATWFLVVSFWRVRSYVIVPEWTLANYGAALTTYSGTFVQTTVTAFAIASVATTIGFAFAYVMRFHARRAAPILLFCVLATLFAGYLTKIYVWRTILGESGILNAALLTLGVVETPIRALLFSPLAVVVTLVHYLLPFTILPLYGTLLAIDDRAIEGARDLGANPGAVFRDIVLPQCFAGLVAAFALTFLFATGDFATARMVGGTETSLVGAFIQSQFTQRLNQPMGSALAFTMVAISLVVLTVTAVVARRLTRYR